MSPGLRKNGGDSNLLLQLDLHLAECDIDDNANYNLLADSPEPIQKAQSLQDELKQRDLFMTNEKNPPAVVRDFNLAAGSGLGEEVAGDKNLGVAPSSPQGAQISRVDRALDAQMQALLETKHSSIQEERSGAGVLVPSSEPYQTSVT